MQSGRILVAGATGRVGSAAARGERIVALHPPLSIMRLAGPFSPSAKELAGMFTLFDAAGYFSDSPALRETFGVPADTIDELARRLSGPGAFG